MRRLLLLAPCLMLATLPAAAAEIVAGGGFYDAHHPTSGHATIFALDGGGYELRFEDFKSDAGPDLFIYLSTAVAPRADSDITNAEFENLGPRKALTRAQSYRLPEGVAPKRFNSAVVWCRTYSVMFGAAPLVPQ